uniref:Chromosome 16 open reading frame 90 n=1 Tax=Prolemur simus TaxID=1328070 RepID=A0A8C9A5Q2_PROSS
MEALVCAFSELRIREDAVSWAHGHPSHPDTPLNIYEGGLGAQQQQCPSAQGSRPKNFRLRHLRGLALYLPGHMQPAGQCESHWLGQLMAGGYLPQPEGIAWPRDLPQGTLGPVNSHCSALLEAQLPRDSLGNTASSSSMDPAKGAPSQPGPPEGLGLRPKRSWGASEEATCPLCKRTRSGALERL